MVLFVPPGDQADPTRPPEFYDSTFNYLEDRGAGFGVTLFNGNRRSRFAY